MSNSILKIIGNTPMCYIKINDNYGFYAKLECLNPFGSMKDRAAYYVLTRKKESGEVDSSTTIIESSSGNFGISLAATGKILGFKVMCVIDPKIIDINKRIMQLYGAELILIKEADANGTYQKSRINFVKNFIKENQNTYWTNQYNNNLIIESYYSLAQEIINHLPSLTHIYIPISTCGTIAGVSSYLKKFNNDIKVIAVDVEGSKIFNNYNTINCKFPGMGSGITPENLKSAQIDDIIIVTDYECVSNCRNLLDQGILVGASSGGVTAAIKKNISNHTVNDVIVGIFPDRGERYMDNLYNETWCNDNIIRSYRSLNKTNAKTDLKK